MTTAPRRRRWPWILLGLAVALPVAGFVALRILVDPETIRPRLVAAVEEATGRRFTVGGIALGLSLRPSVALTDIALANAPGGSRPEMLTARRAEVQLALIPLLSRQVDVVRIEIDAPDILLEVDAQGRGNWLLGPAAAPPVPTTPSGQTVPATPEERLAVAIGALRLTEARIAYRDARTGLAETIEIPRLDAAAPLAGPTTARGTLRGRGQELSVAATTGPITGIGGAAAWPFEVTLGLAGGEVTARGTLAGAAWTVEATGRVPDLARLAALLPEAPLPPLREIAFAAKLAGDAGGLTSAETLSLTIGRSDLAALRPGLVLNRLELAAPRLDAPLTLAGEAAQGPAAIRLAGRTGTPAQLAGQAAGPVPVELTLGAAGAEATLRGAIRDIAALSGVDLAFAARVPDLAALSPLAGQALPPLRDLAAGFRLTERQGGLAQGVRLAALTLTAPQVQAQGELTLALAPRPGLAGRLAVARLDLDALTGAVAPPPAAGAPATPAAPAAAPPADGKVIPDIELPLAALRGFDADLALTIAELTAGGATWRAISAPIKLTDGRGGIAPLAVTTPGGPLTAEIAANAAAATPTLRLAARAPQMDMAALQTALGQPVRVTGRGELDLDLAGAGARLRGWAGSLSGHLGLAMIDATVEPALMGPVQAALRQRAPMLPALPQRLPVECVALRADLREGLAQIGTLLVDAPAAKVAGTGQVNLRDETLALRLQHDVRAAGTSIRVAAEAGGTLAAPGYRGVQVQNLGEVIGGVAGQLGGSAGALLGALGQGAARPAPLPECGPSLTAARGGRAGPVPTPRPAAPAAAPAEAAPASPAAPTQPAAPAAPRLPANPGEALRGLFGR